MLKNKLENLIASLHTILSEIVARFYFRTAAENKVFPYGVFDVRKLTGGMLVIELDLWGKRGNEITLLQSAELIEELLDGYVIADINHTASITTNNDLRFVPNEDENIIHINLSFNATYCA